MQFCCGVPAETPSVSDLHPALLWATGAKTDTEKGSRKRRQSVPHFPFLHTLPCRSRPHHTLLCPAPPRPATLTPGHTVSHRRAASHHAPRHPVPPRAAPPHTFRAYMRKALMSICMHMYTCVIVHMHAHVYMCDRAARSHACPPTCTHTNMHTPSGGSCGICAGGQ